MAVTLTIAELVAALRLSDSAEELAEATRLLAYASAAVVKYAPAAADVAHDEATRRLAGYLFDMPEAARGDAYANAMRNSGAARSLLPYRILPGGRHGGHQRRHNADLEHVQPGLLRSRCAALVSGVGLCQPTA